ncbi:ribonuclease 3 [Aplysia californica]|uniref:Ribonuclease 3 n=1 Tax=Aplysia californica TaxID=6500 RepID=A0ABM1AD16_APLCA|nr:ribonuclease 3 [Aplysia californica]
MSLLGLQASTETQKGRNCQPQQPRAKDLSNKHPVSALMELCNKRRWGPPAFTVVSESGPDHKKNFLFKVKVNSVEYQPAVASSNKKSAKAQCAAVCLQEMGLLPRDVPLLF